MANPQAENGHVRIANEIMDEVIRRDFSKRQLSILHLIWRLSYGCNKKHASISKMKDFTLCGVTKQNVKSELEQLETCKVIFWDRSTNKFSFNKNHEEWIVTPKKGWDKEEFNQLISSNIKEKFLKQEQKPMKKSSQNKNYKKVSSQNKNRKVLKIRTYEFLKQELLQGLKPCLSKAHWTSKTMFKDSIKNNVVINEDESHVELGDGVPLTGQNADPLQNGEISPLNKRDDVDIIAEHYMAKRGFLDRPATQKDYMSMKDVLVEGIPMEDIIAGIDEAFKSFQPEFPGDTIGSFNYCKKVIFKRYYRNKGVANYKPSKQGFYKKEAPVPGWFAKQKEQENQNKQNAHQTKPVDPEEFERWQQEMKDFKAARSGG